MMGERRVMQEALFYGFSLERHVPENLLLRRITGSSTFSGSNASRAVRQQDGSPFDRS